MSASVPPLAGIEQSVIWHDVECAAYEADLALWRDLADQAGRGVLDLGAGTGRVALDLAQRGHEVTALDVDTALAAALAARARERGLRIEVHAGDLRSFSLGRRFGLAMAPMQVFQLLGGEAGRAAALEAVRGHLGDGGVLAIALADPFEGAGAEESLPPLPDVREQDGWMFQSTPIGLHAGDGATEVERLRQAVAPDGALHESLATIRLDEVSPEQLEEAAPKHGYRVAGREHVPETEAYVGSTVVVLEAA